MKPDWDKLSEEFKDSSKVLIADVDCTGAGEPLCSRFNVEGFPTIKSFSPPDTEGEDYEGGRELDDLRTFAQGLGPGCSAATKENCNPEQLKELEELLARPAEDIEAELTELKKQLADSSEAHETLLKSLQAQYEESNEGVEKLKKEVSPRLKLLRAASAKPADAAPAAAAAKDEV